MTLQKFIAASGLCSRRQAEELIRRGKVTVNGEKAELGMKADEGDDVRVNGKKLCLPKEKIYIKLNKPAGYTCTHRRFKGEKNIFSLPVAIEAKNFASLHVAGRLDKDSRGLVLLTNDGELTEKLTHPRYGHGKVYKVKSRKLKSERAGEKELNDLTKTLLRGIDIGEGDGVVRAKSVKYLGDNKFEVVLTEGKKRQIRRMFKALGCEVEDLVRTAIGGVTLGGLAEGKWRHLTNNEIKNISNNR
jgi:23S rRNA pseudouridine2605 synthase